MGLCLPANINAIREARRPRTGGSTASGVGFAAALVEEAEADEAAFGLFQIVDVGDNEM